MNLVCTRSTQGDDATLERWYNDHAQLLMASPQLQQAQLFRLHHQANNKRKIEYFCVYHFAQLSDFDAYDSGPVVAHVRQLSDAAAGRGSVEIVQRTQYQRLLHRSWPSVQSGGSFQASLLHMQGKCLDECSRWLNDVLYQMHQLQPLQFAQIYAAPQAQGTELFVLLQSASAQPLPAMWHTWPSPYAQAPSVELEWQAECGPRAQWLR